MPIEMGGLLEMGLAIDIPMLLLSTGLSSNIYLRNCREKFFGGLVSKVGKVNVGF